MITKKIKPEFMSQYLYAIFHFQFQNLQNQKIMKRTIVLIPLLLLFFAQGIQAQKYFTREGKITFVSDAAMEKIEAVTNSATSVIDMATGAVEFAVLIKGFQFKKALMQEHFNENYMESSKFPKATFKGKIDNFSSVNLKKDGTYPVTTKGKLTIHGVTKDVDLKGQFVVKGGAISGTSTFNLAVADYDIKIPSVVKDNVAKVVKVDVSCNYQEFNK